ncbi:PilW family protein [Herbaspirillum rubrisubalbicans]|uniref:Pilus assembly protein PilW n=1 Tax=Herbaspirillum rubrisubalbicans TaxID=80842 RepID=A0AAD0UDZ3_9BURK|nr:PilW family protein [Herbaspirillum rubrisubalbicans]AYR25840.1 pilus assembly protein PilW [Herbaspirillum rubrisubalbicans]
MSPLLSPAQRHGIPRQAGLTLVELMIALAVGLLVVLVAGSLLQQARSAYQDIDDAGRVQETGRLALDHLQQALRQAAHLPWETLDGKTAPTLAAGLRGLDNSGQAELLDPATGLFGNSTGDGVNHSDVLMLGLFGTPRGSLAQVGNCSGAEVAAGPLEESARSWVIYYIAPGTGDEAELRCRYQGKNGVWTSDAIARGVEAMQLRYAIDSDGDGAPDRWLDATAMPAAAWRQVVLVRIALLVRGSQRRPGANEIAPRSYDLFLPGRRSDAAWRVTETEGEQRRRAVFQGTVMLRNLVATGAAP